jgi:hypothetical protein
MATYNRAHLLARSLACYEKQYFPNEQFEIIVIDDHSTDGTRELVLKWSKDTGIRATVMTAAPKPGEWTDCGWIINAGIRASNGKHVVITHPECLPGRLSVAACVSALEEFESKRHMNKAMGLYACCKPYYMSQRDQSLLDTVLWASEGPLAVRKIPGFYDNSPDITDRPLEYTPQVIEKIGTPGYDKTPSGANGKVWHSWVFGGCSRETWKRLGGMLETSCWGSVDLAFLSRRAALGISNHTCIEDDTIAVHQNHNSPNDVPTPRDMDAAHEEAGKFSYSVRDLVYPVVDNLGW